MISDRVRRSLRSEFGRSAMAKIGVLLVLSVVFVSVFAPFLVPYSPYEQDLDRVEQPPLGVSYTETTTQPGDDGGFEQTEEVIDGTWEHPLGTDTHGHDMLSRVIYGARISLLVGILGSLIAVGIGVPYGLAAGYFGGNVDDSLMRGADVMLAFPSLVLAIALVGVFQDTDIHAMAIPDPLVIAAQEGYVPDLLRGDHVAAMPETFAFPVTVTLVVALVNWVWFARVARGEALSIREEEYVKAARSLGASDRTILRKHVLPNSLTPIIVLATIQVAAIILLESALSFLGFSGVTLSWGFDIAQGRGELANAWWIATMPGLAIVAAVVGVNLVGDWLRDALDPGIEGEAGGGGGGA